MRSALVLASILVSGLPSVASEARAKSPAPAYTAFPRPPELEHQVKFWRDVFTTYSKDQTVIHDTVSLDRVYSVLDFRGQGYYPDSYRKDATDAEIERIRAVLLRLYQVGPRGAATPEERRIADMFRTDPDPYKFLRAADDGRVRGQKGIRERFGSGFRASRKYLPQMETIFRSAGLPVELIDKNLGAFGDAGMITTNDDEISELVRMLLSHGGRDKYNVDHIGYNSRIDTIQAAVLDAKMKYLDDFNERRRGIAGMYNRSFSDIGGVVLPVAGSSDDFSGSGYERTRLGMESCLSSVHH